MSIHMELTDKEIRINKLRDQTFHKLVHKKVINYPVPRDGKTVDIHLEIQSRNLSIHFEQLFQKYQFKTGRDGMHTEYIRQIYESILKFTPRNIEEEEGWEELSQGKRGLLLNQLLSYIKINANREIYEYANPNIFRTTATKNGKKEHYTLVFETEGLDFLLDKDFDTENPAVQITENNEHFKDKNHTYHITTFNKWFNENKEDILVKSQLDFLEDVKKLSKEEYLTKEEFEEVTGVRWDARVRRLDMIEERIARAWEKENPPKETRRQISLEPKIEYVEDFLRMVKGMETDRELNTQNLRLTDYLVDGMSNKHIEYELFQITNSVLTQEELIYFNQITINDNEKRVALELKTIIKIHQEMKTLLKRLKKQHNKIWNREEIEQPEVKRKKTEIITYDKQGNIIGREKKFLEKEHSNIYHILPKGAISNQ